MQKRSNHNSILFLTTLSVYLGLVLVGAPTGILAQPAAMTRNFDISEEFEIADDLDKKPDDAVIETEPITTDTSAYSVTVAKLLQQFRTSPRTHCFYAETTSIISTRIVPAKILLARYQNELQQKTAQKCLLFGILPRSDIDPLTAFSA